MLRRQLFNYKFWLVVAADAALLAAAHILGYMVRFDAGLTAAHWTNIQNVLIWFIPAQLILFYYFGLYRGMWRYFSMPDMLNVLKATLFSSFGVVTIILIATRFDGFARTVFLMDGVFTFLFISGHRVLIRLYHQRFARRLLPDSQKTAARKKLLILGAGDAGEQVAREVLDNPKLPYQIQGFVDDDPGKIGKRIHGFPIIGSTDDLPAIIRRTGVKELLIAMPSAGKEQMSQVVEKCRGTGLSYKTLPGMGEIIDDKVSIRSIREVSYKDLLGRAPVRLETDRIQSIVRGRKVLITGAGGTIGSELCRQILRFEPGLLVFMDSSEENLYRIEMDVLHEHGFDKYVTVLGKVQDRELLESLFQQYTPDVVFHAAAYKHVPMIERNPWEAVYNNIFASHRLILTARKYKTERFVLVSTDKAVRPTNVMGASKRLTEMLMLAHARQGDTRFMAVRFGNVLGSSGSVIPLFRKQIERGGPITVTHPEITRYFMSIDEAAQLILQAGAMGQGGELFILEMGTPVRIDQMARDYIRLCGKEPDTEIEIKYIGLRCGEKLYEELITQGEGIVSTRHEKIMVLRGESPDINDLRPGLDCLKKYAAEHDSPGIKNTLKQLIPEYTPCDTMAVLGTSHAPRDPEQTPCPADISPGRVVSLQKRSG